MLGPVAWDSPATNAATLQSSGAVRSTSPALAAAATSFRTWLPEAAGQWYFGGPQAIAADASGNVFVGETETLRVSKFAADGRLLWRYANSFSWAGDNKMNAVKGVATDPAGNVFVSDYTGIHKITGDGVLAKRLRRYSTFERNGITGLACDALGRLYACDTDTQRILVYSPNLDQLADWGTGESSDINDVAIDPVGNVCVLDGTANQVKIFTPAGVLVGAWAISEPSPGPGGGARGLAIDTAGNAYVADSSEGRVQVFGASGAFLRQIGPTGQLREEPDGLGDPVDVAVSGSRVLVLDALYGRVQLFSASGAHIAAWKAWGTGPGALHEPLGISVDGRGVVRVAERWNRRVQAIDAERRPLGMLTDPTDAYFEPRDVASDDQGTTYVLKLVPSADSEDSVLKYDPAGNLVDRWGRSGSLPGELDAQNGSIAVTRDGAAVFVADYGNHRIQKYSGSGELLTAWGQEGTGPGEFGWHISGITVDDAGNVYVADSSNHRIQKFTSSGQYIREWGQEGFGAGEILGLGGLACDPQGNLWSIDRGHNVVRKYSAFGDLLATYGSFGSAEGQFVDPCDIAVDRRSGIVYVTDTGNQRIQALGLPQIADPVPIPRDPPARRITGKPVILLVNGLHNRGTGEMGTLKAALDQWAGNGADKVLQEVVVVPSESGSADPHVIDSAGDLDIQVGRLANWLGSKRNDYKYHPIIIIGHSYGGVIARGLVSKRHAPRLAASGLDRNVAGVIQLGSPNGGSFVARALNDPNLVDDAVKRFGGFFKSEATIDLDPDAMLDWNARTSESARPVHRIAGTFLPAALNESRGPGLSLSPLGSGAALTYLNARLEKAESDGMVSVDSARGVQSYFRGGAFDAVQDMRHGDSMPGSELWKTSAVWSYKLKDFPSIVPDRASHPVMHLLLRRVNDLLGEYQKKPSYVRTNALAADLLAQSEEEGTRQLLAREITIAAGREATDSVRLDGAPASLFAASRESTPILTVTGSRGNILGIAESWRTEDGTRLTTLQLPATDPGAFRLAVSLGGVAGSVSVEGVSEGGPRLDIDASPGDARIGDTVTITARITGGMAAPSTTEVIARPSGGEPIALHDDGVGSDSAAGDGVFSCAFVVDGSSGDRTISCTATGSWFERSDLTNLRVGSPAWAAFEGSPAPHVESGASGKIVRWGAAADVRVAEAGVYMLDLDITDAAGTLLSQPSVIATLGPGPATLTALAEADDLADMGPGPLTVRNVRLWRVDAQAGPSLADTATGFSAPLGRADLEVFQLTFEPRFTNPAGSALLALAGEALCTTSALEMVEYSLDGGESWSSATAEDGAFDEQIESYSIELTLPDNAYGVLVRARATDGSVVDPSRWVGCRFIVDTEAPDSVSGIVAVHDADVRGKINVSWTAPEEPSATVAPVAYGLELDGRPLGVTDVPSSTLTLPDARTHLLTVKPSDGAGNAGPASTAIVRGALATGAGTTLLTAVGAPTLLAKYGASSMISGTLRADTATGTVLPGQFVQLQSSASGSTNWQTIATLTTSASGRVARAVTPRSATYYRLRHDGTPGVLAGSTSARVKVVPKASLTAPLASRAGVRDYRLRTVLKPRHTSGTYPVRIELWRLVGRTWRPSGYVRARASNVSDYSAASARYRFPSSGRWRLRAYHPTDAGHSSSYSSFAYVNVY